jgi:predicted signal transduction protein with EAL and GGDEF domain
LSGPPAPERLWPAPDQAPVTASIGLSELKADRCDDWRKLIEIADRRMYVAKRRGRNQVCDSDDIRQDGCAGRRTGRQLPVDRAGGEL